MAYQLLATVTMVVHFGFLAYVVFGGFLPWRWPEALWPHLLAAGWGGATVVFSIRCPLTAVENWARQRAGEQGLSGTGFIDHYIEGVLYPAQHTAVLQLTAASVVFLSWAVAFSRLAAGRAHPRMQGAPRRAGPIETAGSCRRGRAGGSVADAARRRSGPCCGRCRTTRLCRLAAGRASPRPACTSTARAG